MKKSVGVYNLFAIAQSRSFKREALMFNQITIPNLQANVYSDKGMFTHLRELIPEIEWLTDKGVILHLDEDEQAKVNSKEADLEFNSMVSHGVQLAREVFGSNYEKLLNAVKAQDIATIKEMLGKIDEEKNNFKEKQASEGFVKQTTQMSGHVTRMRAAQLRESGKVDAYPILPVDFFNNTRIEATKDNVIQIVLNTLPIPDDSTSWEQIIEYRNDPDSQNKFLDLRNWMTEVARAKLTPTEVEEKLEYLLSQYQRHMMLHKMKTSTSTLETVVTTTAEMLGDLVSFKWGKAAQALFSFKRKQVSLLEGELTAPGSEVAYIVKAKETL